jgi:alkanesulfonate monooxygenase SsuD/methylene tetrahydromethanopterin reductase-like flavin-dependent oxidoreductase (luciferase family)
MRIGLALPQYDYSVVGQSPLRWRTIVDHATVAERVGYDSLWLSDHLFLDLARYGGPSEHFGAFDPLVTLAALARVVTRPRLGTLVLCEALRPAAVAAKALASIDVLSNGRLDVGIGAGWYEPDYAAIGVSMPTPGVRLTRLRDAVIVLRGLLGGGPCTHAGPYHAARDAINEPAAVQRPCPPITVGGKGDRLLALVAELADGWNTCWVWTPAAYRERLEVLERACDAVDRDPRSVVRSIGLYALGGENERDLERRFEHLRATSPEGVLDGVTLDDWRVGRLVGTVEQIREQAGEWAELGVDTLIVGPGAVPFAVSSLDDVELLATALRSQAPGDQPLGSPR